MGMIRRLGMIVFVVAAVLGVGVLAALWFGWEPLLPAIAWLMSQPWFFAVEAALLGITALGLAVILVRALAAPSKRANLSVERDIGSIAITQGAIQSTVRHVVEAHRGLSAESVRVSIVGGRNPRMAVQAKVDPGSSSDLGSLGETLQNEIAASLAAFTGYPVESVRITFSGKTEAVTPSFTQQAQRQEVAA